MEITAFDIAQRFVGFKEVKGSVHNPAIVAMLRLDNEWPTEDETPWCSAFCNYVAWLLRLPRSKSLAARSWLTVGLPVTDPAEVKVGFDVVILSRGEQPQPDASVINASGHVAFYAGMGAGKVLVLGGNQGDAVTIAPFATERILGVRRLSGTLTPTARPGAAVGQ